jgi:hypothetical protein
MVASRDLFKCLIVLAAVISFTPRTSGQIHLPGGVVIQNPRPGGRPQQDRRSERPDPAEVCPKMIAWLQPLQNEYPNLDLARVPSNKLQQMAVPLFADNEFKKQFAVSYNQLSDLDRRDFFRTHIIPCQTSREYAQQTRILQIFNPPFQQGNAGMGPLSPGQLIPALSKLSMARSTLRADEQSLRTAVPSAETYDTANGFVKKRTDELARVWPSEKTQFEMTVRDVSARSASAAVEAKGNPLLTASASPDIALQLRDAPRKYAALFQSLPPEQRAAFQEKFDDRRSAVLRELLPPQKIKSQSFPLTTQGLQDGAEWYASYRTVFLDPPVIPEADDVAKSYLNRREALLAKMAPQFKLKIESAKLPEDVASMYDDVFRLPEDRQTETYRQLNATRVARADILTKRVEQARLEEEQRAEKAAILHGDLVPSSLKVANLSNAKTYKALYTGDFAHAGVGRSDMTFVGILSSYLENYGKSCSNNLPADKVMMTVKYCETSQHLVNRLGTQVGPDSCAVWSRKPIGVYADPHAFAAEVSLEDSAERNTFRDILTSLGKGSSGQQVDDVLGKAAGLASDSISISQDMPKLISQNGCSSKALARLQENMTRFANGDEAVKVAGSQSTASKAPAAQNLDARSLADDLIRANAAGWLFNQYMGLDGAGIDGALDSLGRPRKIHATYDQKGVTSSGSVDIAFVDGVPSCLYFADDPSNCKPPSPAVVKKFEDGGYRSAHR